MPNIPQKQTISFPVLQTKQSTVLTAASFSAENRIIHLPLQLWQFRRCPWRSAWVWRRREFSRLHAPKHQSQVCILENEKTQRVSKSELSTTVEPLIYWQSRDSISTVLCHSIRYKSPNEQGGATVEIESRDCQDTRGFTVLWWN